MLMNQAKLLFVGLGNATLPNTRHNVGMMNHNWKSDTTHTTVLVHSNKEVKEYQVTFLKPRKFMNISGSCVAQAVHDLSIPMSNLYIFHDDMQRELGKDFKRVRIGIGRPPFDDRSHDIVASFVLSKFNQGEIEQLESLVYPIWTRDQGLELLCDKGQLPKNKTKKKKKKYSDLLLSLRKRLHLSSMLTKINVVESFNITTRENVTFRFFL
ncbi:hypothetical protein RO3G_03229 [Rhizopus delemar RA 99-880]|uniref:Peptidyl-tRNA hydrolase n=1 Tax=Rhizopus delemar (strain RA 99-880 / ATCC MYA-4621 / FGSC 9543 / NRRL 43880) TaxID=246409 RepID=I1BQP5_RHIO9|nr:hypothetical protein RO3G_03229 [Rhizopus delemar RA 99-880]|eukprot:EIE78525.1 hypothetical protein RO3G_03229 [Rhizopus delemar RA 99-880]